MGHFISSVSEDLTNTYTLKSTFVLCLIAQSCLTLATPWIVAYQIPLSIGILQAGILEWVVMPSSRGSFPQGLNLSPQHCSRILSIQATREAHGYLSKHFLIKAWNIIIKCILFQATTFQLVLECDSDLI